MAAGPTLLITRPEQDAVAFAEAACLAGFVPVFEPLLKIVPLPAPAIPLDNIQALVFTSANGVRMFARAYGAVNAPVFAVGDATARLAADAGFQMIESAGGDVDALTGLIRMRLEPDAGLIIHAAGETIAGDLAGTLAASGFEVIRAALYKAEKAKSLSKPLIGRINAGEIDHAAFFSPRTAVAFVRLSKLAGVEAKLARVAATALSRNVATALADLPWRTVHVAPEPTQNALLANLLQTK